MGTILTRPRKNGTTAYMAQIMISRDGKFLHRESRTFDREKAAKAWIEKREKELSKPGAALGIKKDAASATLEQAISKYVSESRRAMGRTKTQVLNTIKKHAIAEMACDAISAKDIVDFAASLASKAAPPTVANYLSHLAAVFAIARPAWGFPLNEQAMADAFKVSARLGYSAKSRGRDRRPTLPELETLLAYFEDRSTRLPRARPMVPIILFALFSTRRQEEITRMRWDDLDREGKRILVRDMKNPGEKAGNDVWCDIPDPALRIIDAMPRKHPEIFPYTAVAISAAFTRACKFLGIEDLHFHDLRHEGVSRLFEMGLSIPRVAATSGHRSWSSLKRYTHIRQAGDRFDGWAWIDRGIKIAKRINITSSALKEGAL